ncbi:MAG TPA: response regulator [Actinomycetota bacterium]|nr:response regulator [Actinomycetota bacterium]
MAKIHIVDDDADIRRLLSYHVIEEGHEVSVGRDGEEILQTIANDQPDLLVLDLMMPKLDGITVLERMDESGMRGATRIVVLSANGAEMDRALGLGADHYMTKPFDPKDLIEVVTELLALSRVELDLRRDHERVKARLMSRLDSLYGS